MPTISNIEALALKCTFRSLWVGGGAILKPFKGIIRVAAICSQLSKAIRMTFTGALFLGGIVIASSSCRIFRLQQFRDARWIA